MLPHPCRLTVEAYKTIPAQEKPHRGEKRGHEAGDKKPAAHRKEGDAADGESEYN